MTGIVLRVAGLARAFAQTSGGAVAAPFGMFGAGLADISLTLAAGQALGITGVNGAGKSTLARVLARIEPADAGTITLLGEEIAQIPPARFATHPLRAGLQMLLQEAPASLPPHQSAQAILSQTAARFAARGGDVAPLGAAISAACTAAGFDSHLLHRLPHQLSQGQAVRLALARALIARPKVLVLDEPTAALDATQRAGLMQRLDALRRDTGLALIVITHDLHIIRLMCDQLLVLDAGRVAEAGATADLLANPTHPATRALVGAMPRL